MHPFWGKERRYIVVRQDVIHREKAMGKTLPLFANEVDLKDYRYSAWITSSTYGPCASPGQMMKTPSRNSKKTLPWADSR